MRRDASSPSAETIRHWIAHEEAELEDLRSQLRPLLEQERHAAEKLARLRDLLSVYGATLADNGAGSSPEVGGIPSGLGAPRTPRPASVSERVRRQVREVLATADAPVHINDIHAAFGQREWVVPGAGRPANITAHLTGAADIISPARGYYRLLAEGESKPSTSTKRAVKRRKKAPGK